MREVDGRFLRSLAGSEMKLTAEGLTSGRTTIVRKVAGCFKPHQDLASHVLRAKAEKIAGLLTEGRSAEAIFFAGLFDWRDRKTSDLASKAGFDSAEPRDASGRWSSQSDQTRIRQSPRVIPIASADDPRGNKMAKAAATAAGLDRAQRRKFHDEITGRGITDFQELLRIAKEIAAGGA